MYPKNLNNLLYEHLTDNYILGGIIAILGSIIMDVSIEKDWVPVIVPLVDVCFIIFYPYAKYYNYFGINFI